MRVGLFGGSFNPAHKGHAHVAETALIRLGLDRVVWLVSPQNPLKGAPQPIDQRLARVAEFAQGPAMQVTAAEAALGSTYSIDTIRLLKARHPCVTFVWIMGADSLASFHRWRGWTDIFRELPIAVVARPHAELKALTSPAAQRFASARVAPGALMQSPLPAWTYLSAPLNFASSTALRERGSAKPR
jgi:nicotinate-nucleotide adenylyltransferase